MTLRPPSLTRVLAIDPTNRGCGFAVLEGPSRLIDWGVKRVVGRNINGGSIAAVVRLLRWYEPELIVLEDCAVRSARRGQRVKQLTDDLADLAGRNGIRAIRVPWSRVRRVCGSSPTATKEQIAELLANRFPELARHRPAHRKPWMSEDTRLAIFDAVAMALTGLA